MSEGFFILPRFKQLWPPEGDNRVTNMDVVFFSDLEDERTAPKPWKPGETWLQKEHPEVCWPQQWLPEDLGSNVRIFEIRPFYFPTSTVVSGHSVTTTALRQLNRVAHGSLCNLHEKFSIEYEQDGQGHPLVFVGHGYGGLVLKQALLELHRQSYRFKDLRSNLCGIVFYGGTNTKLTNEHGPMLMENKRRSVKNVSSLKFEGFKVSKSVEDRLLEDTRLKLFERYGAALSKSVEDRLLEDTQLKLSEHYGAALDLKKVKVCVVNKNKSFLQEIKDYSDLDHHLTDVMDSNDICTPTSKDDPSYLEHHSTDFMDSDDIRTPASKDDPSYLECQLTSVMGSNDICKPTSKDDPSYYTFLKFLQQFLPKGLHQTNDDKKGQEVQLILSETKDEDDTLLKFLRGHQTIDDKKGQEVRFILSERKDKEALGDMEIASTSTRENRDKEMDEKQCVVQHVVCNVDEDHDMLTEEAHKLQTFLSEEIKRAQGHEGPTNFPNLHELHSKFLEDTSVFVGARKVEKDSIEFLFLDAECMSKVVGVGLHQALVTVTSDNDVKVECLSESAWKCSLASMFKEVQDLGGFELIGFRMPKMEEDKIETRSLPSKDVAKQFGVGLKGVHGNHLVTMNKREQNNMFFPVIWEVAKEYNAFKQGDPHVTKRPTGVGSSTGASGASSSGSSQQGKEEGKSVQNWSLLKPWTWWENGKGDEKDDEGKPPGGDPPPNFGPSGEPKMVPRRYTVKVSPEPGQSFRGGREIPRQIRKASMNPKLMIVFFRDQTGAKFLDVTTQTQCNLGCDVDTDNFGWFQDDIRISFEGLPEECKGTDLKEFFASAQKGEEGESTKEITTITLGQVRSIANLESRGIVAQGTIAGFGMQLQGREDTTDSLGANSSRADVEEIRGVKQIEGFNIHKRNFQEDLIYKFCIPTNIKTSKDPMRFLRYRDTFTPIIVGSWDVSKDNACKVAPYKFGVERYLFEIEQGEIIFGRKFPQDYVLSMFINLAMTHLNGLRSDETIQIRERHYHGPAIQVFPSC